MGLQGSSTDFTTWTPDEIKAFLDRRGGDIDDCYTFEQLVGSGILVRGWDWGITYGATGVSAMPSKPPLRAIRTNVGATQHSDHHVGLSW